MIPLYKSKKEENGELLEFHICRLCDKKIEVPENGNNKLGRFSHAQQHKKNDDRIKNINGEYYIVSPEYKVTDGEREGNVFGVVDLSVRTGKTKTFVKVHWGGGNVEPMSVDDIKPLRKEEIPVK